MCPPFRTHLAASTRSLAFVFCVALLAKFRKNLSDPVRLKGLFSIGLVSEDKMNGNCRAISFNTR